MRSSAPLAPTQILARVAGWRIWQEITIVIPLVLITLFYYSRNSAMLSDVTVSSILRTVAFPALAGMGLVVLMIAGEIDLSVSAVMGLSAVLSARLMTEYQLSVWLSIALALLAATGVGLFNAFVVVKLGVNSLIATMGALFVFRGVGYLFTSGVPIYPLPDQVATLGDRSPLGISLPIFLMLITMVLVQIMLIWTPLGAKVFATGGNTNAAEACGINTNQIKTMAFVLTALLSGIAGILVMSSLPLPSGDPIIGRGSELDIIVGVVLGGVSFYGGRGSAIGTLFGILLVQVIRSGLAIARFDPRMQTSILGVLLLLAVSVDVFRHRSSEAYS